MDIRELRIDNLIIYEACTYKIVITNSLGKEMLRVKAVNQDWGVESCGINEVSPLEITPDFLKKNGFAVLNKAFPELWIKDLGGFRYIHYHSSIKFLDFEDAHNLKRVPWVIRYVHQLQNACTDYGIKLDLKV